MISLTMLSTEVDEDFNRIMTSVISIIGSNRDIKEKSTQYVERNTGINPIIPIGKRVNLSSMIAQSS